ncbi:hypothetical protein LXM25_04680 [Dyadobacter sp. LJ53]|uniref:hypothetical protein n=1 Tax=Dyadobacter chenwenxiniae TaxID=2906456 RepID=UPI001F2BFE61|nr:hypothetical protein [Dyadobacter chenwenxiniae]MCF0049340.1 hypothetical protein [Dyadobacter chenwenxiniae]
MMNLDKQITIQQNGKVLFKGKVVRNKELIQQSYADRRHADYIFSSEVVLVKVR